MYRQIRTSLLFTIFSHSYAKTRGQMKEDMWRMIGEDTSTAVCGVGIIEGGSDNIGVREGIKKSTYLVTLAKFS